MSRYEITGQIFTWQQAGECIQAEFFIIDNQESEYITDNVVGSVMVKYATGGVAFEIEFDEYFVSTAGGYIVGFFNLPSGYDLSEVEVQAIVKGDNSETTVEHSFPMAQANDLAEPENVTDIISELDV